MDSRSSYANWNKHRTVARDRPTYHPHSTTKHVDHKSEKTNEEMISSILNMLGRLNRNPSTPTFSRETFKLGNRQTFFDAINAFMGVIDQEAELPEVDQDTLLMLLDLFEYDGQIKNALNPVGAPHTWPQCLAILDFFAQIAHYAYNIDEVEEEHFFSDVNSMVLKTCEAGDEKGFSQFMINKTKQSHQDLKDLSAKIQRKKKQIQHLQASQPPLADFQAQLKIQKDKLAAAELQLRSAEDETAKGRRVMQEIEAEKRRLLERQEEIELERANAQYQITHQECTTQEQAKTEAQVKELLRKKELLKDQGRENIQRLKDTNNRTMQKLAEKVTELVSIHKTLSECSAPDFGQPPRPPSVEPYRLLDLVSNLSYDSVLPDLDGQIQIIKDAFKIKQLQGFVQSKIRYEQFLDKRLLAMDNDIATNDRSISQMNILEDNMVREHEQLERNIKQSKEECQEINEQLRKDGKHEVDIGAQLEGIRHDVLKLKAEDRELTIEAAQLMKGLLDLASMVSEAQTEAAEDARAYEAMLQNSHAHTQQVMEEGIAYLDHNSQKVQELNVGL